MKSVFVFLSLLVFTSFAHAEKNCDTGALKTAWTKSVKNFQAGKGTWNKVYEARFNYLFNANGCPELTKAAYCDEAPGLGDILEAKAKTDLAAGRIENDSYSGMVILNDVVQKDCK